MTESTEPDRPDGPATPGAEHPRPDAAWTDHERARPPAETAHPGIGGGLDTPDADGADAPEPAGVDGGHHDSGHHDSGHHDTGHHDSGHHDSGHHDTGHHDGRASSATTERFAVPPAAARRSDPPPRPRDEHTGGAHAGEEHASAVLDRPVDDVDLATRLRRPGLARSTRILLLLLGAVACLAIGAFIGRVTAPDTGPGSVPDLLGVVESVQPTGSGYPIVTVRSGDGTLTPLRTTAGTSVAVPRPDGPAGLRAGQQVTVHAERGADGAVTAVRVDVPGP